MIIAILGTPDSATGPKFKWIDFWCDLNLDRLRMLKGGHVAVHQDYGIINVATSLCELMRQTTFVKKKIAKGMCFVDVSEELDKRKSAFDSTKNAKPLRPVTPVAVFELKPVPLPDPFETSIEEPKVESLQAYAQRKGLKVTEVLMKIFTLGYVGMHVNVPLNEEMTTQLDNAFSGQSPFPSAHKQPPFQPQRSKEFDRDTVIDRVRTAWRGRIRTD